MFKATELGSAKAEFTHKEPDLRMGSFHQAVPLADEGWRAQETRGVILTDLATVPALGTTLPIPSAQGIP